MALPHARSRLRFFGKVLGTASMGSSISATTSSVQVSLNQGIDKPRLSFRLPEAIHIIKMDVRREFS
jgi:hypothetical protein